MGIRVEDNFYDFEGNLKRFFNKETVMELFRDWKLLVCEERDIWCFKKLKKAWEVVVKK